MFLLHKYSPQLITESLINNDILKQLIHLATYDDVPHIIISGPKGGCKKTLVKFYLEALYGNGVNDITKSSYKINGASKKNVIEIMRSDYHIVIEPTNTNHDKYILQEIIKQYAMHKLFSIINSKKSFKTIVIYDIENLSSNSQAALRRTMEVYANTCRFVMVCNNLSKIFDPLRSRCRIFCVEKPDDDKIKKVLTNILILENININGREIDNIVAICNNNIKEAIWILDEKRLDCPLKLPIYEAFDKITEIIASVVNRNDIVCVFDNEIRPRIYNILTTTISGTDIILGIMERLLVKINQNKNKNNDLINMISHNIIKIASDTESNMVYGRRNITHIDDFVARIIKELIINKDSLQFLVLNTK